MLACTTGAYSINNAGLMDRLKRGEQEKLLTIRLIARRCAGAVRCAHTPSNVVHGSRVAFLLPITASMRCVQRGSRGSRKIRGIHAPPSLKVGQMSGCTYRVLTKMHRYSRCRCVAPGWCQQHRGATGNGGVSEGADMCYHVTASALTPPLLRSPSGASGTGTTPYLGLCPPLRYRTPNSTEQTM